MELRPETAVQLLTTPPELMPAALGTTTAQSDGIWAALRKGLDPSKPADRRQLAELTDDDPVWDVTAHYLAGLCVNLILIASPVRPCPIQSNQPSTCKSRRTICLKCFCACVRGRRRR